MEQAPHPLGEIAHRMSIEDRFITHVKMVDGRIYKFHGYQYIIWRGREFIAAECSDDNGYEHLIGIKNIYKKITK